MACVSTCFGVACTADTVRSCDEQCGQAGPAPIKCFFAIRIRIYYALFGCIATMQLKIVAVAYLSGSFTSVFKRITVADFLLQFSSGLP